MKTNTFSKYIIITFFLSTLLSTTSFAQRFEVTPYYGFMFAGKMNFIDGEMNIKDDWNYGIIFNFELDRKLGLNLELSYDRVDTRATYKKYGGLSDVKKLFDMFIEYYQLGALYNHTLSKKASAFGVFTGGVVRFSPISTKYGDDYRFAVTMGGGVKYFFTKNIGLRLQGRIKLPIYFAGGGLYLGSGGSGLYLGAATALLQMDINAGLTLRLGN